MVLAAAMMVLAAGCQKEEATRVAPVNSVRTVEYSVDNNRQHVTVEGSAEWQALLGECLDRAAEGMTSLCGTMKRRASTSASPASWHRRRVAIL